MLSEKINDALNKQINEEFFSSYLYLAMSSYFERNNFSGFANWMYVQYQEEISHAMKILNYVNERGGTVLLESIAKPKHEWPSIVDVFEEVLLHEQKITGLINKIVDWSISEKDYATNNLLQWFVSEQVEEEASASKILNEIKLIKDSNHALFLFDKELAKRTFVDETKL